MIPPFLIKIGAQYGNKILAGLLATSIMAGGYLYWEHKQEKEGRLEERAKWEERDRETKRQSENLLKRKNIEIELTKQHQQQQYHGALEEYANYINHLNDINNRLRVKSTSAGSNGNAMPTEAGDTTGTCGSGTETLSIERLKSIKAAELLIEEFLIPNSIVK